ncbi:rhomboid family intramembrane serine protease [soil metagenome]
MFVDRMIGDRGSIGPMDDVSPQDPQRETVRGETAPERTRGLILETCYRHPEEPTGVHCTRCNRPICTECMTAAPVGYQCPACVAEARRTAPRGRARISVGRSGSVVTLLIGANIAMFLLSVALGGAGSFTSGGDRLLDLGALQPLFVADGQYWRMLTAMFLHAGVLHIALNMYGIYLFGSLIESAFGTARFLLIYFVSGLMASVTSFTFSDPRSLSVGASGALFGLLGAWVVYNYRRRSSPLASANLQWALMLLGINLVLGFSIARIDNFAHLGGLVAGAACGALAEGFGPPNVRRLVQTSGFVGLILLGIVLTVYRSAELQPLTVLLP